MAGRKRKNKRRKGRSERREPRRKRQPGGPSRASTRWEAEIGSFAEEVARIESLLTAGTATDAVKRAEALHDREATADSAALLAGAYGARIDTMIRENRSKGATALIARAARRLPAHRAALERRRDYLAAWTGDVAPLLRPWAEATPSSPARREQTEELRRWVGDPRLVRDCQVLPVGHPLRRAAATIADALEAVSSGPVAERELTLRAISRRSPFAPWVPLIRAIGAFYREDDAGCRRALAAIPEGTAPARLRLPLERMLGEAPARGLRPAARALCSQILPDDRKLRHALRSVRNALTDGIPRRVGAAIRTAIAVCKRTRPELVDGLRQQISVRSFLARLDAKLVRAALGGSSRKDAGFWRLLAEASEVIASADGRLPLLLDACCFWEAFRRHAIAEGRIAAGGPQEAAVYLRIVSAIDDVPLEAIADVPGYDRHAAGLAGYYDDDQPEEIRALRPSDPPDLYFLDPGQSYARATSVYPDAAVFQEWLDWARSTHKHWRPADEVALEWARALPRDPRPLLYLVASTERRGALRKARKHLQQVEELDLMNADARRARIRLLVATARRHIRAGQLTLAEKDIEALAQLPELADPQRRVFLLALRWCATATGEDGASRRELGEQVARALDDELAARALLSSLSHACGRFAERAAATLPASPPLVPQGAFARAVATACEVGLRMELELKLPPGWTQRVESDLEAGAGGMGPSALLLLGESALRSLAPHLAYAATNLALAQRGPLDARLLLLRARAMPAFSVTRRLSCTGAALALARRDGDTGAVERILQTYRELLLPTDGRRRRRRLGETIPAPEALSLEQAEAVLREELRETRYPTASYTRLRTARELCGCPACRQARGEPVPASMDDDFDDDLDDDLDDEFAPGDLRSPLPGTLAELIKMVFPGEEESVAQFLDLAKRPDEPLSPEDLARIDPSIARRLLDFIGEPGGSDERFGWPAGDFPRGGKKKARRKRRKK